MRYIINKATGVIYPYNPVLLKKKGYDEISEEKALPLLDRQAGRKASPEKAKTSPKRQLDPKPVAKTGKGRKKMTTKDEKNNDI